MTVRELEVKAREHYRKRQGQRFAPSSPESLLVWEPGMKPAADVEVVIDEEGAIYVPEANGDLIYVGRCDYL